jgi:hypothetical protein
MYDISMHGDRKKIVTKKFSTEMSEHCASHDRVNIQAIWDVTTYQLVKGCPRRGGL